MKITTVNPTTPGRRHRSPSPRLPLSESRLGGTKGGRIPRHLISGRSHTSSGRNSTGRITTRHHGGAEKKLFRVIDWKRNKTGVPARVVNIEYDPNRSAWIALLNYSDGDRRYILAPIGLTAGSKIISGPTAPIEPGNALPLANIPVGTPIHNLEIRPGKGAQMVRGAGNAALIQAKEENVVDVKLPSGELRRFSASCLATIGQVSNETHQNQKIGKAGRRRHMGWRPSVRGTAMNPKRHPHGGGEGRSGIGMKSPKSLWGKRTLGKKTRSRVKYSNKYIIKDRRVK